MSETLNINLHIGDTVMVDLKTVRESVNASIGVPASAVIDYTYYSDQTCTIRGLAKVGENDVSLKVKVVDRVERIIEMHFYDAKIRRTYVILTPGVSSDINKDTMRWMYAQVVSYTLVSIPTLSHLTAQGRYALAESLVDKMLEVSTACNNGQMWCHIITSNRCDMIVTHDD